MEVRSVKGARKEAAGQIAGDPGVEAKGQGGKVAGRTQDKLGQVEKVFEK